MSWCIWWWLERYAWILFRFKDSFSLRIGDCYSWHAVCFFSIFTLIRLLFLFFIRVFWLVLISGFNTRIYQKILNCLIYSERLHDRLFYLLNWGLNHANLLLNELDYFICRSLKIRFVIFSKRISVNFSLIIWVDYEGIKILKSCLRVL
jgi:hypothetical protein